MSRSSTSIVARTAIYAAGFCGMICVCVFLVLVEVQRDIYETKIVRDTEEIATTFASFMIGFFYGQGNWIHIEEHQQKLNTFSDTLYSYIVNADGQIDMGLKGFDPKLNNDIGRVSQTWEPSLPTGIEKPFRVEFTANSDLVNLYPKRLTVGDKVVLIGVTIRCNYSRPCGQLRVAVSFDHLQKTIAKLWRTLWALGFFLCFSTAFIVYFTTKRQLWPLRMISERMRSVAKDLEDAGGLRQTPEPATNANLALPTAASVREEPAEIQLFKESLNHFTVALNQTNRLSRELDVSRSRATLAAQVAHDIRSPLATLRVLLEQSTALPDEQRAILRRALTRIGDIANEILSTGRRERETANRDALNPLGSYSATGMAINLASPWLIVEAIASEQRVQHITRSRLEITTSCDSSAYGLFVGVEPTELGRLISNLITNGIEAIASKAQDKGEARMAGRVQVSIHRIQNDTADSLVEIRISDDGVGVDPVMLPRLGERGFTFGKNEGSGLGLHHARSIVEARGGRLNIASTPNKGTTVSLLLPAVTAPLWFPRHIALSDEQLVVVIDDSESAHDLWIQRLASPTLARTGIAKPELQHFYQPHAFEAAISGFEKILSLGKSILFLVDYEFSGSSTTGLDLIRSLEKIIDGRAANIILVTGRFDDPKVLAGVQELGVFMLPKPLAPQVPIVARTKQIITSTVVYACVLVDDDPFVRTAWEYEAKRRGFPIIVLESSEALVARLQSVSPMPEKVRNVPYFIDVSLHGDDQAGLELAKWLIARGCKRVYLATGYEASDLPFVKGLSGVCGKEMPEWLALT